MIRTAMIHSLLLTVEVEIIQFKDNNHVIAKYNRKHYTAVDDVYGEVSEEFRF